LSYFVRHRAVSLFRQCPPYQAIDIVAVFLCCPIRIDDSTEVNAVDLIAREALRQFEPDVYEALPRYKRHLTEGTLMDFMSKDQAKQERSNSLGKLTELASEDRRELVKRLITLIFPPIKSVHGQDDQKWLKERKVCHSDIFDSL
jgi:predicted KAP-like P-loop ATPase